MTEADPRAQAAAARDLAARARRLAHAVGEGPERNRLLKYAEELEEQAARLDAPTSGSARPPVVQQQQQVQQQGPSDTADDPGGNPPGDKKPTEPTSG
jgi:hypothetical protein